MKSAWTEVFLLSVMAAGFLVATFFLGYELGAGNR
jgi:hypothetical protein